MLAVLATGARTAHADTTLVVPAVVCGSVAEPGHAGGTETSLSFEVDCKDIAAGSFASGFLSSDLRGQVRFRMRAFDEMSVYASTAGIYLFSNERLVDTLVIDSPVPYTAHFALHVEGRIVLDSGTTFPAAHAPIDVSFVVFPSTHLNDAFACEVIEVFGRTEVGVPGGPPDDLVDLYRSGGYTFKFRPDNDRFLSGVFYWEPLIELNHDIVLSCPGGVGPQPFTYAIRVTTADNGRYVGPFDYLPGFTNADMKQAFVSGPAGEGSLVGTLSIRNLPSVATISSQSGAFANVNTPAGGPEMVPLTPVTLTYETVTQDGTSTLATGVDGPPPPPGFKHGNPATYFDLTTTALYSGAIMVCIDYSDLAFDDEASLKLFHFTGGSWEDHTVSLDTTANKICTQVTSLSPFAVFEAADGAPPVLQVPSEIVVNATGPEGAPVSYEATATDNSGEPISATCSPASGSGFPIGTTTVTCTATDSTGNTAQATFHVTVLPVGVEEIQVTNDPAEQFDPTIKNGIVAFTDARNAGDNHDEDIYFVDLDASPRVETRVMPASGRQGTPDTDGTHIVYIGSSTSLRDISAYRISDGAVVTITSETSAANPAISDGVVVWQDSRTGDSDIYKRAVAGGAEEAVTTAPRDQSRPAISGSWVVWQDERDGFVDIWARHGSDPEQLIAGGPTVQSNPDVDGGVIVWVDILLAGREIFLWENGNIHRLTDDAVDQNRPKVSGNRVVWEDRRNGNFDIYGCEFTGTGATFACVEFVVSNHPADQQLLDIDGGDIAFTDNRKGRGNNDIYVHRSTDTTPPITTAAASPGPNASGWNNTDVAVSLAALDQEGGSGVATIHYTLAGAQTGGDVVAGGSASIGVFAEGQTTLTYFAVDGAGNQEEPHALTVRIDKTPPAVAGSRSPAPNAAGWNNTDVTVSFTCADGLSGIADCGPSPQVVSTEGAGQSRTATATDQAGNMASATVGGINIDRTAPIVSCSASPHILWSPNHELAPISVTVMLADRLSGGSASALVSATSNEPDNGVADGDTVNDIQAFEVGTADTTGLLRAERSGQDAGRIYTLRYRGTDAAGNAALCEATVTVPHNQ